MEEGERRGEERGKGGEVGGMVGGRKEEGDWEDRNEEGEGKRGGIKEG